MNFSGGSATLETPRGVSSGGALGRRGFNADVSRVFPGFTREAVGVMRA